MLAGKLQCAYEKSRWMWDAKKYTGFRVLLNKAFLVKKKGTKTAVLSRVAKLKSRGGTAARMNQVITTL